MSDTMSFLPYPDLAALLRACGESGEAAAEIIYSHPKEPEARLFSAFPAEGELVLMLRIISTLAPGSVKLHLFDDDSGTTRTLDGKIIITQTDDEETACTYDSFVFSLSPGLITGDTNKRDGLFYYHFTVQTVYGEISVSQNEWEGGCLLTAGKEELSRFQLLFLPPRFSHACRVEGRYYVPNLCRSLQTGRIALCAGGREALRGLGRRDPGISREKRRFTCKRSVFRRYAGRNQRKAG